MKSIENMRDASLALFWKVVLQYQEQNESGKWGRRGTEQEDRKVKDRRESIAQ